MRNIEQFQFWQQSKRRIETHNSVPTHVHRLTCEMNSFRDRSQCAYINAVIAQQYGELWFGRKQKGPHLQTNPRLGFSSITATFHEYFLQTVSKQNRNCKSDIFINLIRNTGRIIRLHYRKITSLKNVSQIGWLKLIAVETNHRLDESGFV